MQQNNDNEAGEQANEDNETDLNDLREAKIEVTRNLFKTILERCGEQYHQLKGFKKFGEAMSNSENVID